uniref:Peptide-methionine (R)-S-oxide reductase n=1 Tax=Mucochytrium quahogii TaxID=96639 RepID=A0A7S2RXD0_9STRA|mmetsp:Transcript_17885/g.29009  ORF Transcript_17885/g.29009 Transcript_17885/m.29009 type:complete len:157 (-) Transcript_17885:531-1001(-)
MGSKNDKFGVDKTEAEWKKQLSKEEYAVIRQKGTERPFTGEYDQMFPDDGYFACRACKNPLYTAKSKFKAGCGWPAFEACIKDSIVTNVDNTNGMQRVEIVCGDCGGHLGHVFHGERATETNERHCVNSISVKYIKEPLPAGKQEVEVLAAKLGHM